MKNKIPIVLMLFAWLNSNGQSGGDFLFTGMYADAPDGFAIVVVNDLPGSSDFYFTDDEWTGSSLNITEGTITWTTPVTGVPSGTVVTFNAVETSGPVVAATNGNPGTIVKSGNFSVSGANEAILAYVGSFQSPSTFIAAISNETISTSPGGLTLSGTNLNASNTIEFELDEDSMTFDFANSPCVVAGMSAACIAAILDESNWITDLGSANNTDITDQPTTQFTALPVELISFRASKKEQSVSLSWVTTTELNNSHFKVERSIDGRNFLEIEQISGSGTTYEMQEYSIMDEHPFDGINYYRLRQVDFDGSFSLSDIIHLRIDRNHPIFISPNPVNDRFQISIEDNSASDMSIYNSNGQLVKHLLFNDSDTFFTIEAGDLQPGIYYISMLVNGSIKTQRFIKN